jgi:hypothetical protein
VLPPNELAACSEPPVSRRQVLTIDDLLASIQ